MKIREYFLAEADELVQVWAKRNAKVIWLGAESRKKVREELADLLMEAYKLGKEKAKEK